MPEGFASKQAGQRRMKENLEVEPDLIHSYNKHFNSLHRFLKIVGIPLERECLKIDKVNVFSKWCYRIFVNIGICLKQKWMNQIDYRELVYAYYELGKWCMDSTEQSVSNLKMQVDIFSVIQMNFYGLW